MDRVVTMLRGLDDIQKLQLMGAVLMLWSVFGLRNSLLLAVAATVLAQRKPPELAFLPFFERWFKESFCPAMSARLAQELAARSKRRSSIIDVLKDTATSWVVQNSMSIQTTLLWDAVQTRSLPTLRFHDLFFMRTATINLGTAEQPMLVSFWGANDTWFLSPLMSLNFDGVSVLDALESARQ